MRPIPVKRLQISVNVDIFSFAGNPRQRPVAKDAVTRVRSLSGPPLRRLAPLPVSSRSPLGVSKPNQGRGSPPRKEDRPRGSRTEGFWVKDVGDRPRANRPHRVRDSFWKRTGPSRRRPTPGPSPALPSAVSGPAPQSSTLRRHFRTRLHRSGVSRGPREHYNYTPPASGARPRPEETPRSRQFHTPTSPPAPDRTKLYVEGSGR